MVTASEYFIYPQNTSFFESSLEKISVRTCDKYLNYIFKSSLDF